LSRVELFWFVLPTITLCYIKLIKSSPCPPE
jgi:hypothetical protein